MKRYGMTIDIDRCTGCGACMLACAVENNISPVDGANDRRGITPIRVYRVDNGQDFPNRRTAFIPVLCQHCGHETPCVHVCPQQAVDVDPATGIVGQMPERCLGCRYCMAACPYHARYFNWWDPKWPAGMERTLNPDVAPRMRGVVEKCNFCHGRRHAAEQAGAAEYTPACVEACPTGAIHFADLNAHPPAQADTFRLLERLGTDPKIYYHSAREWVRRSADGAHPDAHADVGAGHARPAVADQRPPEGEGSIEGQTVVGASGLGLSATSRVFPLIRHAGVDAGIAGQEAGSTGPGLDFHPLCRGANPKEAFRG